MLRPLAAITSALVAGLVGCDAGSADRLVSVRDSAGIQIVENDIAGQAELAVCSVSAQPQLDLGVVEGPEPYQFYRVFDAIRLTDGRIAVVNQGSDEVRFYDADGEHLWSVGREGDGPGEFRNVRRVWQLNQDTLVIWDRRPQRLSVFTAEGQFVRSAPLSPVLMNPPDILGFMEDGSIVTAYDHFEPAEVGFAPQRLYLMRYTSAAELIDTLGTYAYGRTGRIGRPEDHFVGSPLFEARSAAAARGSQIFVATGEEPEIDIRDLDGELVRLVRWTTGDRGVTDDDVALYRRERLGLSDDPRWQRLARASVEEVPVADRFPVLQELQLDTDNNLWVKEYPRPGADAYRDWLVFDQDGRFTCHARISTDLRLFQIGRDHILGMERDEVDVEHVLLYELTRPH